MMQTINPCTTTRTAKTAEIMARYRPIAPKPEPPASPSGGGNGGGKTADSPKIRQSAYLRQVWPHLQAKPTRTRKRGRTSLAPPPPSLKRSTTSLQGFGLIPLPSPTTTTATLPLLPCPPSTSPEAPHNIVDLNRVTQIPQEKDFLTQLTGSPTTVVVSPRPIRPIGSTISIWSVKEDDRSTQKLQIQQKAKEVEEELEFEGLPAVISDSNNKVRLVNSAYKEMVGQPECQWLDSMLASSACKRICGEVTIHFHHPDTDNVLVSSNGVSCRVSIECGSNGKKATQINGFSKVKRLFCESKDYPFSWKLHMMEASDAASHV